MTIQQARAAKDQLRTMRSGQAAVNGIGVTGGDGEYALRVNLSHAVPSGAIPMEIDGVRVETKIVGKIAKLTTDG